MFRRLAAQGPFARVHLDRFDGQWTPEHWDDGGGPDAFEIGTGRVAHAHPLFERDGAFAALRAAWLPSYHDALRAEWLSMVTASCRANVERLRIYAERAEHFQAFDRLYHAVQELLQAVFIARRVYPIAYDEWVREEGVEWLGAPALYAALPPLLALTRFESTEVVDKGEQLLRLLGVWASVDMAGRARD